MKILPILLLILSLALTACQSAVVGAPEQNQPAEEEPSLVILPEPGSNPEQAAPPADAATNPDLSVTNPDPSSNEQPENTDLAPPNGKNKLNISIVYIETHELLPVEADDPAKREEFGFNPAYPLHFLLRVSGTLPDPCHELRTNVSEPDENGRVDVRLYSLRDPELICIMVLAPFEVEIPLQFPAGSYRLYLNGEMIAEFQG